jgi:hypothetical protein
MGRWIRLVGSTGWGWSLTIALAWAQAPPVRPAYAPNQVGVVAAVQGQVEVMKVGTTVGRIVESGEPMLLGDTVTTDADERLQILLLDETVFTIGPSSAIVIDEFVYDPATDAGKVSAEILKGTFRFVTGRIAHKNPESMTVKLPVGTIGVRGTMVVGNCEGEASSVALIGPGAIVVSNEVAGAAKQVSVSRTGFGTTIAGANIPPTPPTFVPPADLNAWAAALGFTPGFAGAAGQQPGQPGTQPGEPGQQPGGPEGRFGPRPGGPEGEGQFGPDAEGRFGPGPEGRFGPGPEGMMGPEGFGPEGFGPEGFGFGPEGMTMQFGEGMFGPEGFGPEGMFGPEGFGFGPEGFAHEGFSPEMGFMPVFGEFFGGDLFGALFFFFFAGEPLTSDPTAAQQTATQTTAIADGITNFDQMRQIQSGVSHYIKAGGFSQTIKDGTNLATPIIGTSEVRMEVDFGGRRIGGGGSQLIVNTVPNGGNINNTNSPFLIPPTGFASSTGEARVTIASGNFNGTQFTFENAGGIIAKHLDVSITFDNGLSGSSQNAGNGSIQDALRTDGPLPPP